MALGGHRPRVMTDNPHVLRVPYSRLRAHLAGALLGQGALLLLSLKWPSWSPGVLWTLFFWTLMLYADFRGFYSSRRHGLAMSVAAATVLAAMTLVFRWAST